MFYRRQWFKNLSAGLIGLALVVGAFFTAERRSEAVAVLPFGGPILAVYYCCNGLMLTLGAPTPGTYMYYWGAPVYAYYNIWEPGPYVLGRGGPAGVCLIPTAFPPCVYVTPTTGWFAFLGTSAP